MKNASLSRISIALNNKCNLSCKYCYANKGHYYTDKEIMSEKTALNVVKYITNNFSYVKNINFFGGEPTLSPKIMAIICESFMKLKKKTRFHIFLILE